MALDLQEPRKLAAFTFPFSYGLCCPIILKFYATCCRLPEIWLRLCSCLCLWTCSLPLRCLFLRLSNSFAKLLFVASGTFCNWNAVARVADAICQLSDCSFACPAIMLCPVASWCCPDFSFSFVSSPTLMQYDNCNKGKGKRKRKHRQKLGDTCWANSHALR